jgi:pilus assembly protein Flp/PilA
MQNLFVHVQGLMARARVADDGGATAVEYGLLVALIAAVIIGVVATLGTTLSSMFNTVVTGL